MQIDLSTYYSLVGIIILLSALLVGVIISHFVSLRKLAGFEKKEKEIINAAQDQAAHIISQASDIQDTSRATLEKAVDDLERSEVETLAKKSEDAVKLFEGKIEELNSNNIREFNNVSEDIKKTINLHFEELKKLLAEQTIESQKQADEKIKAEYEALEKELADYKRQEMDKINKNIYQILLTVSKNVFGKRMDIKEHEQTIIDALSEAEKEIN